MASKNNALEIIKVGVILFIITAVAALLLAVLNNITAPIIAKNEIEKLNNSMSAIMPSANEFNEIDYEDDKIKIYEGYDNGKAVGVCINLSTNGYGGAINMVVGVDNDKKVTGVDIVSQSETAGLGTKAADPEFKDQYIGKKSGITVVKNKTKDNEIDSISSATITSKAVTNGVNEALEIAETILNKEAVR